MRRNANLAAWAFGVLFTASLVGGCSDDAAKVEEPVVPSGEEKDEVGEADDSFEAPAEGAEDDQGGEADAGAAENSVPPPSDEMMEAPPPAAAPEAPMADPSAQQPSPQPSGGGIISSGNRWDDCKKIAKFGERKKCFAAAQKALNNK